MNDDALVVVPSERHVERLAREGTRAETRAALRARLTAGLLPDVRFADARETRLTLAVALEEARSERAQLDLFAAASGSAGTPADPLLATLRGRGGASWVRTVAALDEAIGALRSRGATEAHLEASKAVGVASARARMLAAAIRALDEVLARCGARDGRLVGASLAPAIRRKGAAELARLLGATRLRARWILGWEPQELLWWRALDETLAEGGGFARVILPVFDKPLEARRIKDPLEVIGDIVARHLDAAPETESITPVLGDLASTAPPAGTLGAVTLVRAAGVRDEARVVARLVATALAEETTAVERVAIAYPSRDERTLAPLRRALAAEGIVFHDALGAPLSEVPVVAAALHSLVAAESLDRIAVARLLRSGYLDAPRVLAAEGEPRLTFRDAERVLERLARNLETKATAAGEDPGTRLVRTAAGEDEEATAHARRAFGILERARAARTRGARVRAARGLFHELGFAARAGRGALATFSRDEAPVGVDRAERLAVARDVRAWEGLEAALDVHDMTTSRAGASERPLEAEVFRLELAELLDTSASLPTAARAGAVRLVRLADVAGDVLDLLVVLDTNDGVLPRDVRPVSLLTEALESAVARAARGGFVVPAPGELGARDLAALATSAAEATRIVLVTTTEDGTEAPASPSRVWTALERAGATLAPSSAAPTPERAGCANLRSATEITRRARREEAREGFFLDPLRPPSEIAGELTRSDVIRAVIGPETGANAERPLAVTSLERFAQCAFKGYAHAILVAREGEEQRELPDAREEGNLGHAALAAAFAATKEAWARRPRDPSTILARGLAAADAALAASAGHAPLRTIARLRVRESVRAVLNRALEDLDWDFALAEQSFGPQRRPAGDRPWPTFVIGGGELALRGSIDRLDRAPNGSAARVVDYKRSKSTVRTSTSSLGETALQVPIYAAVVRRELQTKATGIYLPTQPKDLALEARSRGAPEDKVLALVEEAGGARSLIEERALELVRAARDGRFLPLPFREAECVHCGVSGGCRKPRFAMAPADEVEDREPT